MDIEDRYLELLKKALSRSLDDRTYDVIPPGRRTLAKSIRYTCYSAIQSLLAPFNLALVQTNRPVGETMMGMGALNNLHLCLRDIHRDGVPGDLIETGVWRGGGTIFMRGFLKVYNDETKCVWVADSFEGLPKSDEKYVHDRNDRLWESEYLAVSLEEVKRNFLKYDLLDQQVKFIKGFFSETIPQAPVEKLALMRLDGDMYESTIVVLRSLYSKLSPGGYVIIDDYGMIPGCNRAVEDFRSEMKIVEPLEFIGYLDEKPLGAFWRKR